MDKKPIEAENKCNKTTLEAIAEGRAMAAEPNTKKYTNIDDLKKALEE